MDLTPELLRIYRETSYRFIADKIPVYFKIGVVEPGIDAMLARREVFTAGLITAHNPLGMRKTHFQNQHAQNRLMRSLRARSLPFVYGAGGDDTWSEQSLLALGIEIGDLIALACEYRQHATVWIQRGKAPELVVTPFGQASVAS